MAKLNKVREELSQRFVEALSMGELPWHSCWQQAVPQNAVTGRKYHGLNALWLSYLAEKQGWTDPRWATYKQASEKGWQVRKGEKASYVEYWAYYDKEKKKLLSWPDARQIFREDPAYAEKNLQLSSRVFAVFNGAQIDGIPELPQSRGTDIGAIRQQRDTLIANMGIGYREQGQSAYYSLGSDTVTLPPEASFDSAYGYMATFLHECGHASGHPDRLNRDMTGGFGSESYAKEELRAEIASAFTAQALGLTASERDRELETRQHMAYIQNWAQAIQDAPEELFKALKDAEKISDYLIEQGEFQPIIDRAAEPAQEYYHFYYHCRYLFTAAGEAEAERVVNRLNTAFAAAGWCWSDSGDVVKSEERMAPPTILFHADPEDQPVYRAVTEELLQEHLHCYCQPESPKTAVQKSHSKGPEL